MLIMTPATNFDYDPNNKFCLWPKLKISIMTPTTNVDYDPTTNVDYDHN